MTEMIVSICVGATGVFLLLFGAWGIIFWDQYSKLLSNIKLKIDNFIYNKKDERR